MVDEMNLDEISFRNLVEFFEVEIIAIHEHRANVADILSVHQARQLRKHKVLLSVKPSKYGGKRVIVSSKARKVLKLV